MGATNPNAGGAPGGGGKGGMAKGPGPGVAIDSGYGNFTGAPPVQMPSPQQLGVNPQQLNQSLQGLNLGGLPQYGGPSFGRPAPMPAHNPFMKAFGNIDQTGQTLGGGNMTPAAPSPRLQNFQGLLSRIYGG